MLHVLWRVLRHRRQHAAHLDIQKQTGSQAGQHFFVVHY